MQLLEICWLVNLSDFLRPVYIAGFLFVSGIGCGITQGPKYDYLRDVIFSDIRQVLQSMEYISQMFLQAE